MVQKMTEAQISRVFNDTYDKLFEEAELASLPEMQMVYESLMNRIVETYGTTGQVTDSFIDALSLEESLLFVYISTGTMYKRWWSALFGSISERAEPSDTLTETHMRSVARQRVQRLSTSMRQTARDRATSIINRFQEQNPNANIQQIADLIINSDDLKNSVDALTMRTVRTEVNAAANESIAWTASSMNGSQNLMKRWITAGDERVRPTHARMGASKPIPQGELFNVNGTFMRFPSDPEAFGGNVAGEVINCRCRVAYIPKRTLRSRIGNAFQGLRSFFGL